MTRELTLELCEGIYCERVQREWKGRVVDWLKKTLCTAFVRLMVSGEPERIKVAVSDTEKAGWVEVKMLRVGHYRWWWEFMDEALRHKNHVYGLYPAGEDILMSIFPNKFDERDEKGRLKPVIFIKEEDRGPEEYSLWVRIVSI